MSMCYSCFTDFIARCNDNIFVKAQLEPATNYNWLITDKFENQYQGDFTTDANGFWAISIADLPSGLLTEYSGQFKLQVFTSGDVCAPQQFKIAQVTDCILFTINGGNRIKDTIGCEF